MIKCSKCGLSQSDTQLECLRCGIVFAKVGISLPQPGKSGEPGTETVIAPKRSDPSATSGIHTFQHDEVTSMVSSVDNTPFVKTSLLYEMTANDGNRHDYDEEFAPEPLHMDRTDLLVLASGPVFAGLIMTVPLLNHIFMTFVILTHEMGHGIELVIAAIFFYRALSGATIVHMAERPLYCILSWFIILSDIRFADRLAFSAQARSMYEEAKGGDIGWTSAVSLKTISIRISKQRRSYFCSVALSLRLSASWRFGTRNICVEQLSASGKETPSLHRIDADTQAKTGRDRKVGCLAWSSTARPYKEKDSKNA